MLTLVVINILKLWSIFTIFNTFNLATSILKKQKNEYIQPWRNKKASKYSNMSHKTNLKSLQCFHQEEHGQHNLYLNHHNKHFHVKSISITRGVNKCLTSFQVLCAYMMLTMWGCHKVKDSSPIVLNLAITFSHAYV